jgi:hypothetical protein
MFRVSISSAFLGVVLCAPSQSFAFQSQSVPAAPPSATKKAEEPERMLSRREGAALRDFTLARPARLEPKPDCSHLMHQVFTAAGLDYPYANSFDIYRGVPQFRRVKNPQAGDLIVWRGHVGLVVDPEERSFYSSLGSGIKTDQYDNRYWRKRGQPRFYRYLTAGPDKTTMLLARTRGPQPETLPVADRPGLEADATVDRSLEGDEVEVVVAEQADPAERFRVPESIPVVTSGLTPSKEEVAQALSELTNGSGGILRTPNLTVFASPVVVFDQLKVEKVKIKRDRGWAEVRIKWRMELTQDKIKENSRSEKRRWELRRTEEGWQAMAPADRVYVPADVSVQVLAEKLAVLSRDHKDERAEQAKLARLLNTMLNGD